jgi:hypothetical protein
MVEATPRRCTTPPGRSWGVGSRITSVHPARSGSRACGATLIDDAEIERRKPVWAALSELWLDTELAEDDLRRIAGVMEASG